MDLIKTEDLTIHQIKTGCLAQFAYILSSGTTAIVIDPLRDIQPYIDWIKENMPPESKVTYVGLTHYHADFVSGYMDLANQTGATVLLGPNADPSFEAKVATDGELIPLGENYQIKVLHTPGHTLESSCYLVQKINGGDICVLTGDTLFLGDVGRPDLAQKGDLTAEGLARMMFNSLKKLTELDDSVMVLPGHGAGSACGKNISSGTYCDIGTQKSNNYAIQIDNEDEFAKTISSGIDLPPEYFGNSVAMNKAISPPKVETLLEENCIPLTVEEFKNEMEKENTYVIDGRGGIFDEGHIPGSIYIPLDGQFAIWAANLIKPQDRILLVVPEGEETSAVIRLARTGLDNVVGYLAGGFETWKLEEPENIEKVDNIDFETKEEFLENTDGFDYVDCRGLGEWNTHGVLKHPNNRLLSLHMTRSFVESNEDFGNIIAPTGKLAISCRSGNRSKIVLSFLKRLGMKNVYNVAGGWLKMNDVGVDAEEPKEEKMVMEGYV